MTFSRKLSSFALVAVLAGLSLSACGDKDSAGDKADSKPAGGNTTTLTAANFSQVLADSQIKAKSAHVDMSIGVGGQAVKAEGDIAVGADPADSALAMTMDVSSMKFEMRLVGQVMYMNMGQMTQDKYLKIDLNDENSPFAKQYGQLMDQMDPSKQLDQLKSAVTSFEKKGDAETIDGVKAQPYVVKVDTSKLKSFTDLPAEAAGQIPDSIVYTVYVGSDDLMRRMEFEIAGAKSTMNYTKWGEPVDIKAPAASEISDQDLSALMGGGSGPA